MAVTGFLIWAVTTIALRLAGQYVFRGSAIPLLIITLPVMIAVAIAVLRRYRLPEQRALAAVALVAPGMLLDTISAIWFPAIFPNIRADAAGAFGGWLLFCNVVVLLTAVTYRPAAA
ncbi:MAG TPA: DUF5367 family protein [Thermoanaerobaculia bacterium]|jgi:drug/metabolite transporter (DMT)-like permease|nr:DUF5367 family protein [Thermoanaerobaculia bacterium]